MVATSRFDALRRAVRRIRKELGGYISEYPSFAVALKPLDTLPGDPPEVARLMHAASLLCGIGPMAAVAGTTAQLAAEAARAAGCVDTIVNNGGDIFLHLAPGSDATIVGLYGGSSSFPGNFALQVLPEESPLAICSSSSRMGHSVSYGDCDLATVCAADGALADAAATMVCNQTRDTESARTAAEAALAIPGILGVLILIGESIVTAGKLPELIPVRDMHSRSKVLRHPLSNGFQRSRKPAIGPDRD